MTDAKLKNKYQEMIEEDALKKSVVAKKLEKTAKAARDQAQKMMLGDDGRVGEAVIMSFFNSLYGNLSTAYNAYKEQRLLVEKEMIEKNMEGNKNKIERLDKAAEATERINEITRLSIQRAALEQKLADNTLDASARKGAVESLNGIAGKIDDIAKFYETTSDLMFKEVEATEDEWLGENASLMKDLRNLSPEIMEKALPGVSLDDIINSTELVDSLVAKVSNSIIENDLVETIDKLHVGAEETQHVQELK